MLLAHLEKQTGKLCREIFDFVGGTSVGALIGSAVAAGVPASSIVDVMLNRTREVFTPGSPASDALMLVRGYKYGVQNLYKVVHSVLGEWADKALNDLPIDVMFTAIAELDGHPWYLVKDNKGNAGTTGKYPLAACATASGAAPIYFDSYTMPDGKKMVDGGLGVVGNPVFEACVEAFEFCDGKYDPADTIVVSLGTGLSSQMPPASSLISRIGWVLDVTLDAPRNQQVEMVERLYQPRLKGFHVLDIDLQEAINLADLSAIPKLREYGEDLVTQTDWLGILQMAGAA